MNAEMIEQLKAIARKECFSDDSDEDVSVEDCVGRNVDSAFQLGAWDGKISLAREVLKAMKISWE